MRNFGGVGRDGDTGGVDVVADLSCDASPEAVRKVVSDLGTYPDWLDIVGSAVPASPAEGDTGPVWDVVLRASVGPLRRSKRLRMIRTVDEPTRICFERSELDGRHHSPWRLEATITDLGEGTGTTRSTLTMRLHYGGSLWIPLLDRLLTDEIERSRPRLVALIAR